jgi:Cysteine-rich CPXCG
LIQQESITCPYCWQTIEIVLDLSADEQRYVEDCSVCCRPIVIAYRTDGETLASLEIAAESEE